MKNHIFLLLFFVSWSTHTAQYETSLLDLPVELICYIFNFIPYKTGYKKSDYF